MKLYVDALGQGGAYRACTEPTELAYDPVSNQLALPRFIEALGYKPVRAGWRLFHVERARFLPWGHIDHEVGDLHTLVVVNCIDPLRTSPTTLRMLWEITGGAKRRQPARRPTSLRAPAVGSDDPDRRSGYN